MAAPRPRQLAQALLATPTPTLASVPFLGLVSGPDVASDKAEPVQHEESTSGSSSTGKSDGLVAQNEFVSRLKQSMSRLSSSDQKAMTDALDVIRVYPKRVDGKHLWIADIQGIKYPAEPMLQDVEKGEVPYPVQGLNLWHTLRRKSPASPFAREVLISPPSRSGRVLVEADVLGLPKALKKALVTFAFETYPLHHDKELRDLWLAAGMGSFVHPYQQDAYIDTRIILDVEGQDGGHPEVLAAALLEPTRTSLQLLHIESSQKMPGLGRHLLNNVSARAVSKNQTFLVNVGPDAEGFYRRLGFAPSDTLSISVTPDELLPILGDNPIRFQALPGRQTESPGYAEVHSVALLEHGRKSPAYLLGRGPSTVDSFEVWNPSSQEKITISWKDFQARYDTRNFLLVEHSS
jgi:hypothetical protein